MEFRLYAYLKSEKDIKSTNDLIRYVNACKIPITLPSWQHFKLILILKGNITNCPDLLSKNNKKSIGSRVSHPTRKESDKQVTMIKISNQHI